MKKTENPEDQNSGKISKIKTSDQTVEAIFEYWDKEKMQNAEPLSMNVAKPKTEGLVIKQLLEKDDDDG